MTMDFAPSEEQRLLVDTLRRALKADEAVARILASLDQTSGWSRLRWQALADLGVLALPFEEADGGLAASPETMMLAMIEFGRAVVIEPVWSTLILGGSAVRHAGSAAQRERLIARIIDGSLTLAFAHGEPGSRWQRTLVRTRARCTDGQWHLTGQKHTVLFGASADEIVVSARCFGSDDAAEGIGLFLVPAAAAGLSRKGYRTQDALEAADLVLDEVVGEPLGDTSLGAAALERILDDATAGAIAEAVGAMEEALQLTIGYLKTRQQFGRPIGDFQALQHRAANLYIAVEQARSMAFYAAAAQHEAGPARSAALAAALAVTITSARLVAEEAIQLHGGIGMTMEYRLGHLVKRLAMLEPRFGSREVVLDQLARHGGLAGEM